MLYLEHPVILSTCIKRNQFLVFFEWPLKTDCTVNDLKSSSIVIQIFVYIYAYYVIHLLGSMVNICSKFFDTVPKVNPWINITELRSDCS